MSPKRDGPDASDGAPPPEPIRIPIRDESDIVEARQQGRALALSAGLAAIGHTVVATAISEVARNILDYAREGEVLVWQVRDGDRVGVRVVARDSGPGIPDLDLALQDGFSTGQGLGLGLPGARRLMDDFEIRSTPGEGTVVTLTKWADR